MEDSFSGSIKKIAIIRASITATDESSCAMSLLCSSIRLTPNYKSATKVLISIQLLLPNLKKIISLKKRIIVCKLRNNAI